MTQFKRGRGVAWLVFALVAVAMFGNFYVYDSIGPVADLLQRQRGFSDTQIGMLNAIYSLPNIVLILVGGMLVDRFGAARMTVSAPRPSASAGAAADRVSARNSTRHGRRPAAVRHRRRDLQHRHDRGDRRAISRGGSLAFAMGLSARHRPRGLVLRGHVAAWFADAYAQGWQPPLVIAMLLAAASLAGRPAPTGGSTRYAARRRREAAQRASSRALLPATCCSSGPPTGSCWCCACSGTR